MNNLVANKELCEQFVKLGIKFKTVFYWTDEDIVLMPEKEYNAKWKITMTYGLYPKAKYIPAPTVAEIMEELPRVLHNKGKAYYLRIEPEFENNGWACQYSTMTGQTLYFEEKKKLKNALSLMLCFLIKEKLIN